MINVGNIKNDDEKKNDLIRYDLTGNGKLVANRDLKKGTVIYASTKEKNILCTVLSVDKIDDLHNTYDRHVEKTDKIYREIRDKNIKLNEDVKQSENKESELKQMLSFNVRDILSMTAMEKSSLPESIIVDGKLSTIVTKDSHFYVRSQELPDMKRITDEIIFMYKHHEYLLKYWIFADEICLDIMKDESVEKKSNIKISDLVYISNKLPEEISLKYTLSTINKHVRILSWIMNMKLPGINSMYSHRKVIDVVIDVIFLFMKRCCKPNCMMTMDFGELLITTTEDIKDGDSLYYNDDYMITVFNHDLRVKIQSNWSGNQKFCKCIACNTERLINNYVTLNKTKNTMNKKCVHVDIAENQTKWSDGDIEIYYVFKKMFRSLVGKTKNIRDEQLQLDNLYLVENFALISKRPGYITAVMAYCNPMKYHYPFLDLNNNNLIKMIVDDMNNVIRIDTGASYILFVNALYNFTYLWCLSLRENYKIKYNIATKNKSKTPIPLLHLYMIKNIKQSNVFKMMQYFYAKHYIPTTKSLMALKQNECAECVVDPTFSFTIQFFIHHISNIVTIKKKEQN
jgi:hypothetical protein